MVVEESTPAVAVGSTLAEEDNILVAACNSLVEVVGNSMVALVLLVVVLQVVEQEHDFVVLAVVDIPEEVVGSSLVVDVEQVPLGCMGHVEAGAPCIQQMDVEWTRYEAVLVLHTVVEPG